MATVIVAIIAEIILYLMEKDAVVYMVLLNMTDDDLKKDSQFRTPDLPGAKVRLYYLLAPGISTDLPPGWIHRFWKADDERSGADEMELRQD